MNITFYSLLDFLGFVQGTLLGLILILSFKKNRAIPLLGIFLIGYSFDLGFGLIGEEEFYEQYPKLLYLPINFYWLFMPALFLYTKSLAGKIEWKTDYRHLLPGILEFIFFTILFLFPVDQKVRWWEFGLIEGIHILISYFLILSYVIATLRLLANYKKRMEDFYSSLHGKRLRWVKWVCYYVLLTLILMVVLAFFDEQYFLYFEAANVVFIFWVALSGFRQVFIDLPDTPTIERNAKPIDLLGNQGDTSESQKAYQEIRDFIKKREVH